MICGVTTGAFAFLVTCVTSHAGILSWSLRICCWSESFRILAPIPSLPFFLWGGGGSVQVRWVFFTEFLQCDSASWRVHTGVVPTRMVAMGTSLLCLRRSGSHPTLKALVPKLIYWRWVLIMDAVPLSKTVTLHVHNLLLLGSSRLDTQQLAWGQLVSCAAASLLTDPANFCFRFSVRMS